MIWILALLFSFLPNTIYAAGLGACVISAVTGFTPVGRENIEVISRGHGPQVFPHSLDSSETPSDFFDLIVSSPSGRTRIEVIIGVDAYKQNPDILQTVSDQLALLPASRVNSIHTIRINPHPDRMINTRLVGHTETAIFSVSEGGTREIDLFPMYLKDAFDKSIPHEFGHALAQKVFGTTLPPKSWQDVALRDGAAVSAYAKVNLNEDFAETVRVYVQTNGGQLNPALRDQFANRFAYLDTLIRGKPGLLQELTDFMRRRTPFERYVLLPGGAIITIGMVYSMITYEPSSQP